MSGAITLTSALQEMGSDDHGQNFIRIEREAGAIVITGLTDDEVRALAPRFLSLVSAVIGAAS